MFKKNGKGDYSLSWKNCKTLARTITYFSFKKLNYDKVLDSLFGLFTDKPMKIFNPTSIATEYLVWDIIFKKCNIKNINQVLE